MTDEFDNMIYSHLIHFLHTRIHFVWNFYGLFFSVLTLNTAFGGCSILSYQAYPERESSGTISVEAQQSKTSFVKLKVRAGGNFTLEKV